MPQLEEVGKQRSVSMSPSDAPSLQAMKRVGKVFNEFNSDSSAMIVLEGDKPLGADAHLFYNKMIKRLEQDKNARTAHPGLLGGPADRSGLTEYRRQSGVCTGLYRR